MSFKASKVEKILCVLLSLNLLSAQDLHFQKQRDIDFSALENPFVNPYFQELSKLKIQAIFQGRVKIDNVWYAKNDYIHQALIKEIYPKEIILEYDNTSIVIKVKNETKIIIN